MITDRVPCRKFYNGGAFIDKIYDNCCGIDVHKKLIVACFRKGNKQEIREFGATTRELLEMVDWLKSGGCEMAAMESTASYWKPLYNIISPSFQNRLYTYEMPKIWPIDFGPLYSGKVRTVAISPFLSNTSTISIPSSTV